MPIPGAAIRLGRCTTGLAATFQATTCRAHGGCLQQPPPLRLPPEDWPGLRPAMPLPAVPLLAYLVACNLSRSPRSRYCAITHADPGAACCAITHACGWTCAITHVLLWMDLCYHPQAYCAFTHNNKKKHVENQRFKPLFPRRNARARFFNLLNSLTSLRPKGRGTPAGFPHPSGGSPSRLSRPPQAGARWCPRSLHHRPGSEHRQRYATKVENRLSRKGRRRPAR